MKSERYSTRLLKWWVALVIRHYLAVFAFVMVVTAGVVYYCYENFRINTDLSGMISDKLRFKRLEKAFHEAFPDLTDTIVIVVNAETTEDAIEARKAIVERLKQDTEHFMRVSEPGAGRFFERNGLLFLSVSELEELSNRLAQAQPLIGVMTDDFSLPGLLGALEKAVRHNADGASDDKRLADLAELLADSFSSAASGRVYKVKWEAMLTERRISQESQFIIVKPYFNVDDIASTEAVIVAVKKAIEEAGVGNSVKTLITGDIALAYDNYMTVKDSVGLATILSVILVCLALFIGLGSVRLVICGMTTLMIGLIWTTGFALSAIGSLNLISVTFAVLFIGLGIDYSIQFCLRYRELIDNGNEQIVSVVGTATGVGRALFLSCITTAMGFYAFLPTPYEGVAELGLISGTGMFISFFLNLTMLPALLMILPVKKYGRKRFELLPAFSFPYQHPRKIVIWAIVFGILSCVALPGVYFDFNPLNLYDKSSESITAIKRMFENPDMTPWTISVLAENEKQASAIASTLEGVKEVRAVATINSFVPDDQDEKMEIISDMALFMQIPKTLQLKHVDYERKLAALEHFEIELKKSREASALPQGAADRLLGSLAAFRERLTSPDEGKAAFDRLEKGLLSGLPTLMKRLESMLSPQKIKFSDIPEDIVRQYVSEKGFYRVQVFPRGNMLHKEELEEFVIAVKKAAPDATDTPVTVYETGQVISSSFRLATLLAIISVVLLLIVELKDIRVTAMILLPLLLSILLTAAFSVIVSMPLNYANVIVLPLLIGIGVHSGIMFMIRYLEEPPIDGNMTGTSAARAIFLSSLTMIISTGTLIFSNHRGIFSIGVLLTVCFALLLVSVLVLMPSLTKLFFADRTK